jgi:hypothetical protein
MNDAQYAAIIALLHEIRSMGVETTYEGDVATCTTASHFAILDCSQEVCRLLRITQEQVAA